MAVELPGRSQSKASTAWTAALSRTATAPTLYLFETERVVVPPNHDIDDHRRARAAVELTRWLTRQGFPSGAPTDIEQPLDVDDYTVTLWHYYLQNDWAKPTADHLGTILRRLNALPTPPIELSPYQPLKHFGASVTASTSLAEGDRTWLLA